jgi:hypothetical protein
MEAVEAPLRLRVETVAGSQFTFEQYQSPSLHEAGHAVIAAILGRKLKELSVLHDLCGSGYVCREIIDAPGQSALEEIAIALAGEEAPYLWNGAWITPSEHDRLRIESVVRKHFQSQNTDQLSNAVRPCVQAALSQLRNVLSVLAQTLSSRKVLPGKDAEAIIRSQSLLDLRLKECLADVLATLS